MKKRILFVVVLTVSLVMLVGTTSASAQPNRKITGSWQWDWPGFHGWGQINVHEVGPGNAAKGMVQLHEVREEEEEMVHWQAHAVCVDFYTDEATGHPAAAFVVQADRVKGSWWDGKEGDYWTIFVVDGGTPGSEGDLIGATWDPDRENWYPKAEFPGCDFVEDPDWFIPSKGGNFTVHGYP